MTNILTQPKFSIAMVNYKTLELTKIALEVLMYGWLITTLKMRVQNI